MGGAGKNQGQFCRPGLLPTLCKPLPLDVEACSPKAAANTHTCRLRYTFGEHFILHWVRESFRECGAFSPQERRSWSSGQPFRAALGFRSCLERVGGGLHDVRRLSWTPDSEPHPRECSEETQVEGTEKSSREVKVGAATATRGLSGGGIRKKTEQSPVWTEEPGV